MKKIFNRELITIMLVMGMAVMAMSLLTPILPLFLTSFGISPTTLGLMLATGMVGMVVGESSGGIFADRIGFKLPLAVGTFLCAPLILPFTFVRTTAPLFLTFFCWGVVRAAVFGPSRGHVGNNVPPSAKATFMAVYAAILAGSRGLGSLASGFIADNLGYNWNFYISATVSVLGGILLMLVFRKAPLFKPNKTAAGVADMTELSRRSNDRRPFIIQCIVAALYFLGTSATSFLPLFSAQVAGLRATEVGILFTVGGLVSAAMLIPMGRLADSKGKKTMMLAGLIVFGIGMSGLALSRSFSWLIAFVAVESLGGAMFTPAAVALVSETVPAHWQNSAMGIYGAAEDTGVIAGSAASGVIWTGLGPAAIFVMSAVSAGFGAIITASFIRGKQLAKITAENSRLDRL